MTKTLPAAALIALILGLAPALAASPGIAQTAASMVGAEVKDSKGKPVGRIERVIDGPDGKPAQVLVRVDRVLRTLPAEAMAPSGAGYASVLSRAEIAALPPSD
jgi:hypothetical protein